MDCAKQEGNIESGATIHDVARLSGVSVSTASRILNGGTKGLRKDAALRAEQVLEAAKRLKYRPSSAARGLVLKRSFSIGLIGSEMNNPVRSELVKTLGSSLRASGFQLFVSGVDLGERSENAIDDMLSRRIDGLVLANVHADSRAKLEKLAAGGFPVVSFGHLPESGWDSVQIDYGKMAYELSSHLLKAHGLRRIVFLGPTASYPRFEAYARALAENGGAKPELCLAENVGLEAGKRAVLDFLSKRKPPEAFVCHNDLLAIGAMAGLRELGLRVPQNVAATGIDDIEFAAYSNPALTTAGVDSVALAHRLFELVMARLGREGGGAFEASSLPLRFSIRESCGCAAARKN